MFSRKIPCKVCGNLFTPCRKQSGVLGAFNYHTIACSKECGEEYFRRVIAARNHTESVLSDADITAKDGVKEAQKKKIRLKKVED